MDRLIGTLPARLQAALGLAGWAGLRLGEVLALDWEAVDLDQLVVRVERSWDHRARRFVAPKSRAGHRAVPILHRLAVLLGDHRVLQNHAPGLLFPGHDADAPMHPTWLRERLQQSWKDAGLTPLGFHEARHTAASLFIAAGLNPKTVSTYLGHASISITLDRYGHLFPGSDATARELLDRYLGL